MFHRRVVCTVQQVLTQVTKRLAEAVLVPVHTYQTYAAMVATSRVLKTLNRTDWTGANGDPEQCSGSLVVFPTSYPGWSGCVSVRASFASALRYSSYTS